MKSDNPLLRITSSPADRLLTYVARTVVIVAVVALGAMIDASPSIQRRYLLEQDIPLLLVLAVSLWVIAQRWRDGAPLSAPSASWRWAAIGLAAAFSYVGAHWWLGSYPVSRDEILADFQAIHLSRGQLGWPIPRQLTDVARAVMPLWTDPWIPRGYWVSQYLPVNSLLRGMAGAIGDARLTGPLLLTAGYTALWRAGRRIWPDQPRIAWVALSLALTSTQLLATAMTPYAMTAHFAFNAMWLACFMRGGRWGHGAAISIGLAATGLHQVQFHLLFIAGPILWLYRVKRYRLALVYSLACLCYLVIWLDLYPRLLVDVLGHPDQAANIHQTFDMRLLGRLERLRGWDPLPALTRFFAWQNVLLLPLMLAGTHACRDGSGQRTILWGLGVSCVLGLATTVFQGHGYGYRYLHGAIPAFCLFAAGGWLTLERREAERGKRLPATWLWSSMGVGIAITLPFALLQSERFIAPYKAAYRAARDAPADVVLVDHRAGAFLQDIVRYEPGPGALILDMGHVSPSMLDRLCARYRVMLLGTKEARTLGVMPAYYPMEHEAAAAARQSQLQRLHCGKPVPLPPGGGSAAKL